MIYRFSILPAILLLFTACQLREDNRESIGGMLITSEYENVLEAEEPVIREPSEGAIRIEEYFSNKIRNGFNGTIIYAENGEITFSKASGFSNLRTKDSLELESAFQLASVSKPITALALLKLYEMGKVNLEDTVQQYLPEFPYSGISIRMLLNHRSGLSNYMYFSDEFWPDREIPITNRDVLDLMVKHKPKPYYPPNRRYNYSNTNYMLLALIIEEVSEMSFEAFVKLNIFLPLDMSTSLIYNKKNYPDNFNQVKGYSSGRRMAENSYLNGVVGDKGVYASALDLFKLDQALYNGSLVSDSTLEEAFSLQHDDLRIYDNYGLGWRINASDPDNKVVYHTGWWKGFRTYFLRELGSKKTLIVLSNTNRSSSLGIRELISLI